MLISAVDALFAKDKKKKQNIINDLLSGTEDITGSFWIIYPVGLEFSNVCWKFTHSK